MAREVDPRAVLEALHFPCATTPVPVSGGWDTSIWRFQTTDGANHALRLLRPGESGVARREQAAIEAAAAGGVPVAAVEAAGEWRGRPALVLRWARGAPLLDALKRRPLAFPRLARGFADAQARLHAIAAPPALQRDAPEYWIQAANVQEPALVDLLLALPASTTTLVHLDYHPLNVLAVGDRVTAVIDWTNGAAGDRWADVARTAALLVLAPLPAGRERPLLLLARRLFYQTWRRRYRRLAGPLSEMTPFLAWAGAKFLRDTERRLGQPGVWATERDLQPMRRWLTHWKSRAGVA